jgi:hypothetical protein
MIKASLLFFVAAFVLFGLSLAGFGTHLVPEGLLAVGLVLALLSLMNRDKSPTP